MRFEDIKNALKGNNLELSSISASELSEIMKYTKVSIGIDEQSQYYYLTISIEDLVKSDMPIDKLEVLKEQGWTLSDNEKTINLFYKFNY